MASNHTANLALNQWEATDPVLREDFNADNQKLDAALADIPKITAGEYQGNGAVTRVISLPFTPKVIYLCQDDGQTSYAGYGQFQYYGGIATTQYPLIKNDVTLIALLENGFQVTNQTVSNTHYYRTNNSGSKYRYIAIG